MGKRLGEKAIERIYLKGEKLISFIGWMTRLDDCCHVLDTNKDNLIGAL
jgi:hypothetical protein